MSEAEDDLRTYKALLNDEGQYSIWPEDLDNPRGWSDAGHVGTRESCLAYIRERWSDMRPMSLRRAMESGTDTGDGA